MICSAESFLIDVFTFSHIRSSQRVETCNLRSILVNIHFFKYHIWEHSLRPQTSNGFNNDFARASRFLYISSLCRHGTTIGCKQKTCIRTRLSFSFPELRYSV